jgi:histidine ammonia-lyase
MATFAARRLGDMADNTAGVLAVEYLAATQGIDLRAPLKTSSTLQRAAALLRERVSFYEEDRIHAPDIEQARRIIQSGAVGSFLDPGLMTDG